jgi:hypothetical protein
MTIYTTDTYKIESIVNQFKTIDDVTTWVGSMVFVQGLPLSSYATVTSIALNAGDNGLIQEDFDVLGRFTANVVPVLETSYIDYALNRRVDKTYRVSNAAISPVSMYQNAKV